MRGGRRRSRVPTRFATRSGNGGAERAVPGLPVLVIHTVSDDLVEIIAIFYT
jgi:hypothetical protein